MENLNIKETQTQRANKYKRAGQLCLLLRLSTEQAPSYCLAQYWTSPRRTDQPTSAHSFGSKPAARRRMATLAQTYMTKWKNNRMVLNGVWTGCVIYETKHNYFFLNFSWNNWLAKNFLNRLWMPICFQAI